MKSISGVKYNSKHSQAQIIVTVLLILIVLSAVGLVGTFVVNLVKDNLQGTDCFKTIGEVTINKEYTEFNSDSGILNLSISRGTEEFNLSGLSVAISAGATAKPYTILPGDAVANVIAMYGDDLTAPTEVITLPQAQETLTYQIKVVGATTVESLEIAPIIGKNKKCDISDSASL